MSPEKRPSHDPAAEEPPAFSRFYEATYARAFSLAMRLTSDESRAAEICEAAYIDEGQLAAATGEGAALSEAGLFERVRALALDRAGPVGSQAVSASTAPASTHVEAVRAGLPALDAAPRRTVELAYFGGMSVPAIASLLAMPEPDVRAAMRAALLQLGSLVRDVQDGSQ